jgi:hypothetical protein
MSELSEELFPFRRILLGLLDTVRGSSSVSGLVDDPNQCFMKDIFFSDDTPTGLKIKNN